METKSAYDNTVKDVLMQAHIIHRAFNTHALLCVFPEWGTSIWLHPEMIKDAENINVNNQGKLQNIFVSGYGQTLIEYAIFSRKWKLLRYKKGEKR